jgi:hypothetical protein
LDDYKLLMSDSLLIILVGDILNKIQINQSINQSPLIRLADPMLQLQTKLSLPFSAYGWRDQYDRRLLSVKLSTEAKRHVNAT